MGWVLLLAPTVQAGILDLAWDAPTTNADGTALTDLSSYRVYSGTANLTLCPPVSTPQVVASSTPAPAPGTVVAYQLTGLTDGTTYFVRVTAVDLSGNESTCSNEASGAALPDPLDTTPPAVSLTAPTNNATISGSVTVSATASDNVGVAGVQFQVDGANLGSEDTASPYSVSWNTTTATNGPHTVTAVARDAAGNTTTSSSIAVTVDNSPPAVTITAPTSGVTVSGTVTVSATASDNVGVVGVQFRVDGTNIGTEDTTASYSISWNTTTVGNGAHTLTAVARDAAGNTTTSGGVTVTVSNGDSTPPTVSLTAPANNASVSGTITVAATASDNVGVVGVQFRVDGTNIGAEDTTIPYSLSWNTTTVGNGAHTLTAVARDAAGNTTTSGGVTVTVDNSPPTVSLTAPPSGATVAGTVTVAATASDNVGVVGVQFRVDGANLGAEDTTSLYSVSWNTTTAANGLHTVTAVARDAAGNTTTSSGVTATVDNSPPTVAITAPASGVTVSGTVTVSATASDNVGVVGVQFRVDGTNIGAEDTTSPYSLSWNTTTVGNGAHTLTAVARDAAGNTTTSSGVTVTVSNPSPPPLNITTTSLPAATVGTPYSQTLTATGGTTPYTWTLAVGSLPPGLTLSSAGVLSGTPTTAGTFSFTIQVTDSASATDTQPLSVTVSTPPPLNITTTSLPAATVGTPYSQTLTATGGTTPYTWSRSSGTLPPGLTLSTAGVLSGTPTTAGTFTFTVQVTDSASATATQPLSLTVNAAPPAPSASSASAGAGCFIATAAYGSALEPQVVLLRAFRDQYLVTNPPGQAFVQWYDRTSPPLAARIRQSPPLRRLVRVALWPLVGVAWLTLHPPVGGTVLLGAGITGWAWHRRKKSHRAHC